ncbi:STAS domain-containing protein [Mycolicibacterium grossiae]|uniref:Anti-sigma factor antagonist n=1 Tax=Mycolicibacterium grossiae TaxID=1552759 RepID=A0A1E8QA53_9MYCO|nr:STAS domain-containing protein [Mycolicibacterium grossiae]OFJ55316.1 hypothetical protein BEL07_02580 [Mycolicibacterium grossiae]QEM46296.1 STAS domain-containing protein [Mycolicibacterium grossiae]
MTTDGVMVVAITGVIDMLTAPDVHVAVRDVLAGEPAAVLIDLTGVEFLASAGLEVLVNAHRLAGSGTRLAVVADGPATSRPIQITGVDDYVPLYATANEAMAALIGGPPSA